MPLAGRRILIVEDEALIALDLAETLEQFHAIIVGSVNNVAAARKLILERTIDCAVLDVQLSGETIESLIPELDARQIPRVFTTAYTKEALPKAWRTWPSLHKPMLAGDVVRAIARVIAARGPSPEP
jgi:DNA-binding NtrC family response regulator